MSQLIAYKSAGGVVLAADSLALEMDMAGNIQSRDTRRLVQLTPGAGILAGGAADGEGMCRALKDFISSESLTDVEDIFQAALPFLASEYEQFMRRACEVQPIDPVHQVYFILGGQSEKHPEHPYRLYFLWTKKKLPQLDADEILTAFSTPRILRLEYGLNAMSTSSAPLAAAQDAIWDALSRQAEQQDEVGGPLVLAVIDEGGFRWVEKS
jgi:20S proteasome alpha/beta subunit